jgi:putative heme-binding domain-containing protein
MTDRLQRLLAVGCFLTSIAFTFKDDQPANKLDMKPGDHISIIGNTLADRMQHDGWLETLLQSRFPGYHLVLRNLGFSGDELTTRLRSADFGSPDAHLSKNKSDVIFAFFGYNESFVGPAGLDQFKKDLERFIDHTVAQHYNGKTAPRLVVCSPIGHENLHDRNLPDGSENNKYLELYTIAMEEVARAKHVPFVDLFHPTLKLYASAVKPLTINGIHLNGEGNKQVAQVIDQSLFAAEVKRDPQALEKLRQAVLDKNFTWFNRHRTVDGYSIFGGRADLRFVDGQTNRDVAQREMEVLDLMTANRDRRIWKLAQGQDEPVDDGNTPPFIPVKTNKPGAGPNGEHIFLDGSDAIREMTVAKGMKINVFASEKEFPELAKPVQMAFDAKGRLWVAAWPSYPHWKPKEEMNDKLLILEDTDGDGKADKCTVFADHLHCPTGFAFYNGGVLLAQAPDLMFLKDTSGGDKANFRERVLSGIDSADTHHTANSFATDPGGAIYFQEGTFHHTQVETPYGPPVRCANAGVYRYEPRTQKFDAYVSYGFANPHGHVFDHWGQDFVYDGTGANPYHGALFSGHVDYPRKHAGPPQVYQQRTRPCPGVEILSSRHFPEASQGNLLVANVIGFQGILQYKVEDKGASFTANELEPLVYSKDPNFRPSDLKIGPDGAIYFLDWQNPIIGHMQHNLRDPSRDRTHGRIYRITYEGRPLLKMPKIAGEPIDRLLELLKEPEDRVRGLVKVELGARSSDDVIPAVQKWVERLDKSDPAYEHHLLEALWVHQYHNVVNADLLKRLLQSGDFRARAAAVRVLCYWRDRVPEALNLLKQLAADSHPRVRLEAVRAASFFTVPDAVEVAIISAEHPDDEFLQYVRNETMKTLEPYWKKAVVGGWDIAFTSEAGTRYFLHALKTDDLLKMKSSRMVYLEMLQRGGIRDEQRKEAVSGLAHLDRKAEPAILLGAITANDKQDRQGDDGVMFDLVRLLTERPAAELAQLRPELEHLAKAGRQRVTRQLGFMSLIAADGSIDKAWNLASQSVASLRDLVDAMPFIRDPGLRANLYPKVEPLLSGLPNGLAAERSKGTQGRYVRVSLPRRGTLTLAEVEVYSDGQNVARKGKASQKNTAHGGAARRAIDGETSGHYEERGQSHTQENTPNPWWEVDLGREFPVDTIVIYNRTDGDLGKRLDGFTLTILDGQRQVVAEKENLPAPEVKVSLEFKRDEAGAVRHAAMNALTFVRGKETATFEALARYVRSDSDRQAAIQALQRIPTSYWTAETATPLLEPVLSYLRQLPPAERTTPAALDALQFGHGIAGLLPSDQARRARKQLGELGVPVIRLGTVPDQMLYDKERIVVQAGKPAEIIFENNDIMPHNFVITRPGALEEIGVLAEATGTQPGAQDRQYVPISDKIILSSQLLQPRNSQKLSFTAPATPGVYPYVCTYPGHWRRMFGALYVVPDIDEYQADAEGYLTRHPLPAVDPMLKFNRPRKEWKWEELAPAAEQMTGRSFANGKQLFQVASCASCHKLNGVGQEFGPDLTKLDPKQQKPIEILRDILEPSFRINEKYTSYIFETESGKLITGLILEETPSVVKVIENPLAKTEPIVLKRSDIAERKKSPTSMMPKGLLDKLTRDEILDLVSYVASGGNPHHSLFQGEHHHGH